MLLILCVNWVTSRRGMEINEKNDLKQSVRLKKGRSIIIKLLKEIFEFCIIKVCFIELFTSIMIAQKISKLNWVSKNKHSLYNSHNYYAKWHYVDNCST